MNSEETLRLLKRAGIGTIISVLLIIGLYVWWFFNLKISSIPSDWASFATYVNGTVGTLISILSLFVLGYITFIVARNSNAENRNLFVLKKKMDAYEELNSYIPTINRIGDSFKVTRYEIFLERSDENPLPDVVSHFGRTNLKNYSIFAEFCFYLSNFKARYAHIFDYNFDNKEYSDLITSLDKVKDNLINKYSTSGDSDDRIPADEEDFDSLFSSTLQKVDDFILELHHELEKI